MRTAPPHALTVAVLLALAACTEPAPSSTSGPVVPPRPSSTGSPDPGAGTTDAREVVPEVEVTGMSDVVTGLDAPWGVALLPDGDALVTLRDSAQVVRVSDGTATPVGGAGARELVEGTRSRGEGGLLGIALAPDPAGPPTVHLYRTTPRGNEVVSARLVDGELSGLDVVLDGIPASGNHNGGRIAFGPDGMLYIATGDAGLPSRAQDPDDLGGKILRVTPDGDPAPGNPDPDSPVWSLGHRNVQGLGWGPDGTMFASEFGQNTWDELNVIEAGGNYGWPLVEGTDEGAAGAAPGVDRDAADLVAPVATWPTADASPSGLAVTAEAVYLAGLRGARLWRVPLGGPGDPPVVGPPQALLEGELGRLRAVLPDEQGRLWVVTNNTDGRGDPRAGDDRIVRVAVR
ncbi:sorbosone dehydrogenase family protein [uncultured Cellulomonas sp.]|uniref:PQQ-dependent sugar dehydrogenase n=1 Tax=uncultured Cellulomonas sp. TaxID=189682 RepID=UPI00261FAD50|nr:PQQ-dependent sugar dehydrogenase [uncultured Cellulomonas sp.]